MRFILLFIFIALINSCEDPVPFDYVPNNVVEAFIVVGEPIRDIRVMRTQNLSQEFDLENSLIRDAEVRIFNENVDLKLEIEDSGTQGYYYPEEYLVEPLTNYNLEITLSDGSKITGSTRTPTNSIWVKKTPNPLKYPIDTTNLPDRYSISWEKNASFDFYHLQVKALDTIGYGQYLDPPTEELNRRIEEDFASENYYYELTNNAFLPTSETAIVWDVFKFYGMQEITIFTPDLNWQKWFLQHVASAEYNELLNSLEGNGFGTFASAGAIRDTFFLVKNQP